MLGNIQEFMGKITIRDKDFSVYEDNEKGIMFVLNTVQLLGRVDYLELDKEQYKVSKFQQKIDDLEYNIVNVKKPIPKSEITGKEEDKLIITEKEVAVRQIWNVSNGLGIFKSFTNKEDAFKLAKEINNNIFKNF